MPLPVRFRAWDFLPREFRRHPDSYAFDQHWNAPEGIAPRELAGQLAAHPSSRWLLGKFSDSPDGYVREAIVERLAELRGGEELPFLLLRANDWVGPVRDRARTAVEARLTPDYAPHFLRCADLLDLLRRSRRVDHAPLLARIEALLLRPDARPLLLDRLRDPDPHLRHRIWRLLVPALALDDPLWDRALVDPAMARDAARLLAEALPADRLAALTLRHVDRPRVPAAPAHLLARLAERFPDAALPALDRALFSPARKVRQWAQHYRRGIDMADGYRSLLTGSPSPVALLGLGETGNAGDAPRVLPYTTAPSAPVRAAALTALASIDAERHLSLLVAGLRDPSPTVIRATGEALGPFISGMGPELSALCLDIDLPLATRRQSLKLLTRAEFWGGLPTLIRLLHDPEPEMCSRASRALAIRGLHARRLFTHPTAAQRAAIQAAVDAVGGQAPSWPLEAR